MARLYPAKAIVELNGSGEGTKTITLNGALLCLNIARSSGSPTITITDGFAKCVDADVFAADTQWHPQAPIYTAPGVDSGLKTLFVYSEAHEVTITVTTGDTTNGTVTIEFFIVPLN